MKRIVRLVAIALATAALGACATQPTEVNHYQMYLPQFPSLLVNATPVAPPPDPTTYTNANDQQQKTMLRDAYDAQTTNVMTCNIDKGQISSWWDQQTAAVAAANAASGTAAANAPVAASQAKVGQ
jgi:hypothetical protein